jgi:hypothetical protein
LIRGISGISWQKIWKRRARHGDHNAATFDTIEIHRPELARSYLDLLSAQPGRPLALFAPRRVGKTFFLDHDLAPAAEQSGILPVYVDLWLHRSDPLGAINHTLEETLDRLTVPGNSVGKLARTKIKGVNILGAGLRGCSQSFQQEAQEGKKYELQAR